MAQRRLEGLWTAHGANFERWAPFKRRPESRHHRPAKEGRAAGIHQSINSYLTCVRAYVNWLHAEGLQKDKPRVQLLKYEHKVLATFSPAHVKAMLAFKPTGRNECRTWPAVCVMLDAGPRLSEVLGLRKADIDLDNLTSRYQ